jgi:type IV pilus assembly protein PilY1
MKHHAHPIRIVAAWLALLPALAAAQSAAPTVTVIQDNFTGNASSFSWTALHGACLTAGDATGTIPACVCPSGTTTNCLTAPGAYYSSLAGNGAGFAGGYLGNGLPDATGNGALRLTNGNGFTQQDGGLISNFTYPSANGLQITFTTYAYHGDSGGALNDGADGISFFLIDPTRGLTGSGTNPGYTAPADPTTQTGTWTPYDIGATGGSLGYDCSNETGNYKTTLHPGRLTEQGVDGIPNAYVAVGMDEYGNFQNPGDNAASGPGYLPSSISLRGSGNVAWDALHAYNPTWYPSSLTFGMYGTRAAALHATCSTGYYWNYSNPAAPVETTTPVADYPWLSGVSLPSASLIANERASQRGYGSSGFPPTSTGAYAVPIQYTMTISPAGILNLTYSYNGGANAAVISNYDITVAGTHPLPTQFAFGFAGSIGGSSNIHEVACFEAQPQASASSSAGLNEKQAAEVQVGTQVYFAYYNAQTWAGSVTAVPVVNTVGTNQLTLGTPAWDGSCTLTGTTLPGGAINPATRCPTTGAASPTAQPISAASTNGRQILSYNPTSATGVPFEWSGSPGNTTLSATQISALSSFCVVYSNSSCTTGSSSASIGQNRLNYLRGDRTYEAGGSSFTVSATGSGSTTNYSENFRARTSVLGDIVDSSPTWVGPPQGSYGSSFADLLYPGEAASYLPENAATTGNLNQYPTWAQANATRTNVIYVGANDGLLHGFSAGAFSSLTTYNPSNTVNTGQELIAYIPGNEINDGSTATIVDAIHDSQASPTIDLTSPNYGHNWFVDAAPGSGDVFYGGAWHTWLVGGFGPGGQGIYALDVTNPTNFSESNAASLVVGEWTATTLPNCAGSVVSCKSNLGDTYGVPQIRRFHSGQWGFVFGNGFNSSTGDAGIFIALVNPTSATPSLTFYYLSTATGSSSSPNGIAYTTPVDFDGDHVVDFIYAGDQRGNIWRFDVTSQNPSNWAVTPGGALFSTGGQPITTKLAVASAPAVGGQRTVIVSFGTGQKVPQTTTSATTYASGTQDLYGIWDWNLGEWNYLSSYRYASQTVVTSSSTVKNPPYGTLSSPIAKSNLQVQTITDYTNTVTTGSSSTTTNYATVTDTPVCWYGTSTCPTGSTSGAYGWYIDLPNTNEQIVYNPTLQLGYFIVNSLIPAINLPASCTVTNPGGYTYAINPVTGGGSTTSFFGSPTTGTTVNSSTGAATNGQSLVTSGEELNGTGTVSILTVGGADSPVTGTYLGTQTSSGTGTVVPVNPAGNVAATRLTWKEIR